MTEYEYTPIQHNHGGSPLFESDEALGFYQIEAGSGDRGTWLGDIAGPVPGDMLRISGRVKMEAENRPYLKHWQTE